MAEFAANIITENLYSQVDDKGQQHSILDAVIDHKFDETVVSKQDVFVVVKGRQSHIKITKGCYLCIQWKDGLTWERLTDLKESNPIELAKYTVSAGIANKPTFAWWVPFILRCHDRIILAVNKQYLKKPHKFGIKLPKTVEEALALDKKNGNTYWYNVIQKEMKNVLVVFDIKDEGEEMPPNYQYIRCHMVLYQDEFVDP